MKKFDLGEYDILYESNFLTALNVLKDKECDFIFGPKGGILELDNRGCVVYKSDGNGILFSVYDYLGTWRCLKNKTKIKDTVEEALTFTVDGAEYTYTKKELIRFYLDVYVIDLPVHIKKFFDEYTDKELRILFGIK